MEHLFQSALRSQYSAAFRMLEQAIRQCPAELWDDNHYGNRFWHISYHVLFYTHLYLAPTEQDFVPWEQGRENQQFLGPLLWPPHTPPDLSNPYTPEAVLEYLALVEQQVGPRLQAEKFDAESGFYWLSFNRAELHLYNLRHLQHHTGQLIERLREATGQGVDWVGKG